MNDIVTILRDISNEKGIDTDLAEACRDGAREIERLRLTAGQREPSGASGGPLAWIPATERLPEEGERVLFFVNRRSTSYAAVYAGQYLPVFGVWEYCESSEKGWAAAFVTHWMPLPAQPTTDKSSVVAEK